VEQADQHQCRRDECGDGADVIPRRPRRVERLPLPGGVGSRQTLRVHAVEVVVQRHVEGHRDDRRKDPEDGADQHPPSAGLA
jgi:hypothetical protein